MINVGMDWTPNLVAIPWLASTFTLANLTFGYFLSRLSKTGCIILHGPHHSAQKSTSVGFSPDTTWSKLESFKSVTPGSTGGLFCCLSISSSLLCFIFSISGSSDNRRIGAGSTKKSI